MKKMIVLCAALAMSSLLSGCIHHHHGHRSHDNGNYQHSDNGYHNGNSGNHHHR